MYTDASRIMRLALLVQDQRVVLSECHFKRMTSGETLNESWEMVLQDGIVDYLGVVKEESATFAFRTDDLVKAEASNPVPLYSHCEIDVSFL